MNKEESWKQGTIAIHAGHNPDSFSKARAVPIYQTSAYTFDSPEFAADLFALKSEGNIYTRLNNPTNDVIEKRITALEGGIGALAVSSGMSATLCAILAIARTGDEIIASSALYGGTCTLFSHTFKNLGIKTIFVNSLDPKEFEKKINDKTKLIYVESIPNPSLEVLDFEALADIAHKNGLPLIVDNTVATPYLFKPIDFGVDIVVHSATKFLGGHGTSLLGLVVDSGKFDWKKSGRFSFMEEPDPSYHGLSYTETFGNSAFIVKCRIQLMRDMGFCASPFNSFMVLQGVETLHLRMKAHCENALKVAEYLENSPFVSWVNYPGLKSSKTHEMAKKYFDKGFGSIIGFGIKGGRAAGEKFINSVKLFSHVANIGDAKSLVIHPGSTTHQQLTDEEQTASGVSPDYIRLSIGIEDVSDIIADIEQALKVSAV